MKTQTLLLNGARLLVLTALVGLVPALGHAQEQSFPELTLRKTYLKRLASGLTVEPGFLPVFMPTSITCPGGGGNCTVCVELDAFVGSVGALESLVRINGTVVHSTGLTTLSGTHNAYAMPRAVVTVAPGTHVVEIWAQSQYFGFMGPRSLKIDVFK